MNPHIETLKQMLRWAKMSHACNPKAPGAVVEQVTSEIAALTAAIADMERLEKVKASLIDADKVLDDIDTAGDMFKPQINSYFKYVARKCQNGMMERRKVLAEIGVRYDVRQRNQPGGEQCLP